MKANEAEDNSGTMAESLDGGTPASWGPTGPDGGPLPHLVNPVIPEARPWNPANVPCLRNCKHYWNTKLHFEHGNYDGALGDHEPLQERHICMRIPGVFLELSGDAPVYVCEKGWDPEDPKEIAGRKDRQKRYFELHPDHKPPPLPPPGDVDIDIDQEADQKSQDKEAQRIHDEILAEEEDSDGNN